MSHDEMFRIALVAVFLIFVPIGIYHRIKSQSSGEKLDRRQEGLFILATLRPVALVLWFGLIAWVIHPDWMAWSSAPLPNWLRWIGVGAGVCGSGLTVWTFRNLGKNLTDTVVTRREHSLVTLGPYRWVRHPFYDSAALLTVGSALVAANWFLFVAGVTLVCLFVIRTRTEEALLLSRFGASYQAYIARTGRFLPRILASR